MSRSPNLTRVMREQLDAIREVLRPWGLQSELVNEGPHMCLKVRGPREGVWRLAIVSTPRDRDEAVKHARRKAQKLVREINERLGL